MPWRLEQQIRDLAQLAAVENEDVSASLLLIIRKMRLPRPIQHQFVGVVDGLLRAVEVCHDSAIRVRPKLDDRLAQHPAGNRAFRC